MMSIGGLLLFFFMLAVPLCAERNPFLFQSYMPQVSTMNTLLDRGVSSTQNTWLEDDGEKSMIFNGSITGDGHIVLLFSYVGKYYRLNVGDIAPNGMEIISVDMQNVQLQGEGVIVSLSPGQRL